MHNGHEYRGEQKEFHFQRDNLCAFSPIPRSDKTVDILPVKVEVKALVSKMLWSTGFDIIQEEE